MMQYDADTITSVGHLDLQTVWIFCIRSKDNAKFLLVLKSPDKRNQDNAKILPILKSPDIRSKDNAKFSRLKRKTLKASLPIC